MATVGYCSPKNSKQEALDKAIFWNHKDTVKELLAQGVKPSKLALFSSTPEVAQWLLEKDVVEVDARDEEGKTALMDHSYNIGEGIGSHPTTIKVLLKHGAKINAKDKQGQTALMMAAKGGFAETVKLLLSRGAKVDLKDDKGETALIKAAKGELRGDTYWNGEKRLHTDYLATVRALLAHGADVNARSDNGNTALNGQR